MYLCTRFWDYSHPKLLFKHQAFMDFSWELVVYVPFLYSRI